MKNRLKRLQFTGRVLPFLFSTGRRWLVEEGLSDRCEFRGLNYDATTDVYTLLVYCEDFPKVEEGGVIPIMEPIRIRGLG